MRRLSLSLLTTLLALSVALTACLNVPSPTSDSGTAIIPPPLQPGWTPPPSDGGMPLPNIADVVPKITPFVVSIQTEAVAFDVFLRPFPEEGAGSGIIIDSNGYILTNNHVIEEATRVVVTLQDGRAFEATEVRRDAQTDIAVLKINAEGLPAAKFGDSRKLRVGDWVIAVGNALALAGGPTVTKGIVSYLGRSIREGNRVVLYDLIQTDAPINPGNSGGPLVNMAGEVVGMNTAIAGQAQNIGFAVAITPAMPIVESLINKGFVSRPFLGIVMQDITPSVARQFNLPVNKGALVTSVQRGSPAERAGLRQGDIIFRFGGSEVATASEVRQAILAHNIGDEVEIGFFRGSTQQTVRAALVESPPPG